MEIVTRAEWNARDPKYVNALNPADVSLFIVHYSGASRSQTVRSIQDYCMDNKGHSDIDYNAVVKDGKHYIGRGWNKGGHTLNNNSRSYGVCVVGQDGDATDEDMNVVRNIYEMVCATVGRRITMTTHRGVLGASYTSCPGSELEAWVREGMPYKDGTAPAFPAFPGRNLKYTKGKRLMRGEDVKTWQARMRARGWRLAVDGVYGPESAGVATKFQREKGLIVDGIVGPQTWRASWVLPIT